MTTGPGTHPAEYRERLVPSPGAWLVLVGLGAALGVVALPIAPEVGIAVGVVGIAAMLVTGWVTAGVVAVLDGALQVGRARIPLGAVAGVETLDDPAMRAARGPRLDARAFLFLRGWVPTGARIAIDDPDDPTPYWLVSTRHPHRLAAAVEAARADL